TLLQSARLNATFAGAEANVAVALALWGHAASVLTVLPDTALGSVALAELRKHGVDVSRIQRRPGRLGLYFLEHGALQRAPEVLYDRAQSAFAATPPDAYDWPGELAGVRCLHISGVTPAVGASAAASAVRGMQNAAGRGVLTSFDCNHRSKLWSVWQGDARAVLSEMVASTEILFATERDIAALLGLSFDSVPPDERAREAAKQAFARFPRLQRMYGTVRVERSVDEHTMSAELCMRDGHWSTPTHELRPIVDRIGTGDAFAAGVLHGILKGMPPQATLDFGLASACLKHSIPGDFNLVRVDQIEALIAGGGFSVRR
ncbi:MAG: sugar kinase, partial [Steroidobacteraceae bacterium]